MFINIPMLSTLFSLTSMSTPVSDSVLHQSRIGYYEFGKVLGRGNFANVRLATHTVTKLKVSLIVYVGKCGHQFQSFTGGHQNYRQVKIGRREPEKGCTGGGDNEAARSPKHNQIISGKCLRPLRIN